MSIFINSSSKAAVFLNGAKIGVTYGNATQVTLPEGTVTMQLTGYNVYNHSTGKRTYYVRTDSPAVLNGVTVSINGYVNPSNYVDVDLEGPDSMVIEVNGFTVTRGSNGTIVSPYNWKSFIKALDGKTLTAYVRAS